MVVRSKKRRLLEPETDKPEIFDFRITNREYNKTEISDALFIYDHIWVGETLRFSYSMDPSLLEEALPNYTFEYEGLEPEALDMALVVPDAYDEQEQRFKKYLAEHEERTQAEVKQLRDELTRRLTGTATDQIITLTSDVLRLERDLEKEKNIRAQDMSLLRDSFSREVCLLKQSLKTVFARTNAHKNTLNDLVQFCYSLNTKLFKQWKFGDNIRSLMGLK